MNAVPCLAVRCLDASGRKARRGASQAALGGMRRASQGTHTRTTHRAPRSKPPIQRAARRSEARRRGTRDGRRSTIPRRHAPSRSRRHHARPHANAHTRMRADMSRARGGGAIERGERTRPCRATATSLALACRRRHTSHGRATTIRHAALATRRDTARAAFSACSAHRANRRGHRARVGPPTHANPANASTTSSATRQRPQRARRGRQRRRTRHTRRCTPRRHATTPQTRTHAHTRPREYNAIARSRGRRRHSRRRAQPRGVRSEGQRRGQQHAPHGDGAGDAGRW